MISIIIVVLAFAVAYLASAAAVPLIVRVANTRRLFDFPDRDRRGHPLPVPRLGGVAVFFGLVVALLMAKVATMFLTQRGLELTQLTLALGAASAMLFALGLYDDVRGAPPFAKIITQTAAALLVISAGFKIDVITLPPNIQFSLGWFAVPVTVVWLVGMSNALNLVDGMDGLAGGITILALCVTTGAAIVLGNTDVTWQTFALIGAILGFLRYNVPPAKIFLGDSGSLMLGFLLAALSVKGATRWDGATFALAPLFALAYPLLDTGISILRRFIRGEPLSRADGRHIHHQLRAIGLEPPRAVAIILALSALVGLLGLCVTFAPPALTVAVAFAGVAMLVFVFVYGLRWLQYHEFLEVSTSFSSVVRNARVVVRDKILARDVAISFEGARDIEEVNAILRVTGEKLRFSRLELCFDTDSPASLQPIAAEEMTHWRLEYPVARLSDTSSARGSLCYLLVVASITETALAAGRSERVARILAPAIAWWMSDRGIAQRVQHVGARSITPPWVRGRISEKRQERAGRA
jgi:UDP-GlcNAc:undecaprenyl-phosphate GlcNAc-1-phosphate transferase